MFNSAVKPQVVNRGTALYGNSILASFSSTRGQRLISFCRYGGAGVMFILEVRETRTPWTKS